MERSPLRLLAMLSEKPLVVIEILLAVFVLFFVSQFLISFTGFGVTGELFSYLWSRKLWWLFPMVFMLMMFGLLLIFATASGLAPFIYTLF